MDHQMNLLKMMSGVGMMWTFQDVTWCVDSAALHWRRLAKILQGCFAWLGAWSGPLSLWRHATGARQLTSFKWGFMHCTHKSFERVKYCCALLLLLSHIHSLKLQQMFCCQQKYFVFSTSIRRMKFCILDSNQKFLTLCTNKNCNFQVSNKDRILQTC